ncbi:hypothetical protein GCM10027403_09120 [Arthrobacter tecti]
MRDTERTPEPSAVDVVPSSTEWWEIVADFGPLAILAAALITAYFAHKNLLHRRESEQRSEWWHRAQWALDCITSENTARKKHGLAVLGHLAKSDLAGKEESEMLQTAWQIILDPPNRGRWRGRRRQ